MKSTTEQDIVSKAAAETLDRIRQDCLSSSSRIKKLLTYLEKHLFDPDFNFKKWRRACGMLDHDVSRQFHSQVGFPPAFYLWDARMEVAARLFRDTELSSEDIAILLGFSDVATLVNGFKRWLGLRPAEYRKNIREVISKVDLVSEKFNSSKFLRSMIAGKLEPTQVIELFDHLQEIAAMSAAESPDTTGGNEPAPERLAAEDLWKKISHRDFAEQQLLVSHQLHIEIPALFYLLREKSIEEGRKNRRRGVQVAKLALASLDTRERPLSDDFPNLLAQGWLCLANSLYLADDLTSAEQAITRAELVLDHAGEHRDPLVEAELFRRKAASRWYQRRLQDAAELVDQALAVYRRVEEPVLTAQALILRAGISRHLGKPRTAIADYGEALKLLKGNKPYLCLCAHSGLANCHRLLGEYVEAEEALTVAETLCEVLDFKVGGYQVRWIAGLVKQGRGDFELAENYLEEARSGLAEMGEMGYTAIVLLDLAILYAEQGRPSQAAAAAIEALPLLEALQLGREAVAAVKVLRDAIEAGELTLPVLKDVRAALAEIDRELHGLGAAVDAHE